MSPLSSRIHHVPSPQTVLRLAVFILLALQSASFSACERVTDIGFDGGGDSETSEMGGSDSDIVDAGSKSSRSFAPASWDKNGENDVTRN